MTHLSIGRRARPAAAVAALALATLAAPAAARAQGTLSEQGFGYPPGQLSARALGQGGANAETDPVSAVNPAALASWGRAGIFFQYAPELRQVSAGGQTDRTTTTRFPLVAAATPLFGHATLGLSASTFLDRTFSTKRTAATPVSGGGTVNTTTTLSSTGAANDVRLAAAWAPLRRLTVGLGVHALTGQNRVNTVVEVADPNQAPGTTSPYLPVSEQRTLGFGGVAFSAGMEWRPVRALQVGVSGRHGGTMRLSAGDTLLAKADVPDRYGIGLLYDGIRGTALSARYNWEGWSSMGGLGSSSLKAFDAVEYAVGADVSGPRLGSRTVLVRAGARTRTLPFAAAGEKVRETAFSGGFGVPLALERVLMDVAVQRARRTARGVGASERAWTIGVGFTVRP